MHNFCSALSSQPQTERRRRRNSSSCCIEMADDSKRALFVVGERGEGAENEGEKGLRDVTEVGGNGCEGRE